MLLTLKFSKIFKILTFVTIYLRSFNNKKNNTTSEMFLGVLFET